MLKVTKKTIVFFCDIFIIGCISIGGGKPGPPLGYAYASNGLLPPQPSHPKGVELACGSLREAPTLSFSTVIKKALSFPIIKSTVMLSGNAKSSTSLKCANVLISCLCGNAFISSRHGLLSHHITQSKRFIVSSFHLFFCKRFKANLFLRPLLSNCAEVFLTLNEGFPLLFALGFEVCSDFSSAIS